MTVSVKEWIYNELNNKAWKNELVFLFKKICCDDPSFDELLYNSLIYLVTLTLSNILNDLNTAHVQ